MLGRLGLAVVVLLVAVSADAQWPSWGGGTRWNASDSWRGPDTLQAAPTFDLNFADGSGPALLSSSLTVNGAAMELVLDCHASAISGTNWACATGGTFSEGGSGGSPTSGKAAPFTDSSRGVRGAASGKAYDTASTTVGQIGTQDFAVELIGHQSNGYTFYSTGAAANPGIEINGQSGGVYGYRLAMRDAGGSTNVDSAGTSVNTWGHGLFFADRSGSGQWYINGAASGSAVAISTRNGTLNDADNARLLGRPGGGGQTLQDADVAVFRVWVCPGGNPNCFDTHLQGTIATERFARLTGVYADAAAGAAAPTAMTRATVATLDIDRDGDGVRRLFTVGNGWMRTAKRPDAGATLRTGFLSEPASTNIALQSTDFSTTWTVAGYAAAISANVAGATPNPVTPDTADGLVADGTANYHGVSQTITHSAAPYTFSVFAKAGNQPSVLLYSGGASPKGWCFNVSTCTSIGGFGAIPATSGIAESYGNGWCRVQMTWTATAAAYGDEIYASDDTDSCGSTDHYFTGDSSTVNVVLWGAQVEARQAATSLIVTTTASVTRNADVLQFNGTSNNPSSPATQAVSLVGYGTHTDAEHSMVIGVNPGASSGLGWTFTNNGTPRCRGYVSGAGQWGATVTTGGVTINDGLHHTFWQSYQTNDVKCYADTVANVATDTSALAYVSDSPIQVAQLWTSLFSYQIPIVVTRVRFYGSIRETLP